MTVKVTRTVVREEEYDDDNTFVIRGSAAQPSGAVIIIDPHAPTDFLKDAKTILNVLYTTIPGGTYDDLKKLIAKGDIEQ